MSTVKWRKLYLDLELYFDFHLALISGALSFLNSLKDSGGKLALVTTDSLRATRLTLEKLRIASFFEVVIGRESCLEPKSSGVPATIALRELGVPGKVSICVGDAPMDVHMARRSGWSRNRPGFCGELIE